MSVYACADLHGTMELYKQIKAFLKPDDVVYFLGDAGDRGPEPWEMIKTIYADPQFIYIKGNHEAMLVDAMNEFLINECCGEDFWLLQHNGGGRTFEGWQAESPANQLEWKSRLNKLPVYMEYINKDGLIIMMTHAGFTPCYDAEDRICRPDDYECVWDRHHFLDPWPVETENVVIVHGHTPTLLLADRIKWSDENVEPGAIWYANNHKVDIDNGCFFTGCTCLLNLDTFDEEIFMTADSRWGED